MMTDPSSKESTGIETPVPGRMKLRELLALARERLGDKAADLKTREELEAALFGAAVPAPSSSPVSAEAEPSRARVVITKDFFTTPP